ncbi:MAG: DUF4390 domain-containing protein [Gammaproteobacteria bacterium]|nr:MAG: DUF4390 domain-containing protein [Gammaproteobacteria bacterium]
MQSSLIQPQARRRRGRAALLGVALLLSAAVAAQPGRFDVRSASTGLKDGVYYLNARIDYRLSEKALQALRSGVELTIELQIEVERRRAFLPDSTVASLRQAYLLSYQPLSQRYVVRNLNSGEQSSYATLFSALNSLGRVIDLPVIDAALLEPDASYEIRLRAVLDQNTLPGPLRLFAFWGDSFRLESDWYAWTLKE